MTTIGFILAGISVLIVVSVLLNSWPNAWKVLSGSNGFSNTFIAPPNPVDNLINPQGPPPTPGGVPKF